MSNTSKAHIKEVPDSKLASLDYTIFKELNNYFALEINLHTGRHQNQGTTSRDRLPKRRLKVWF
jgi:hypothetical protein